MITFREKDVVAALIGLAMAVALLIASAAGSAIGCGGMTQIDPPSLQLQAGPAESPPESILDDVDDFMVIC